MATYQVAISNHATPEGSELRLQVFDFIILSMDL